MKAIAIVFLSFSTLLFSQKKKYYQDVTSNIDVKMILMKPIGNNHLAKLLSPFYGFGFGGNLMTPINFGVGADYNVLFSNVQYGKQNLYGSIGSPKITNLDICLTHREMISEEFFVEELAGFSYYQHTSLFTDVKDRKKKDVGTGFNLGGKAIYTLDREGYQQVFGAAKVNFYFTDMYNENPDIQKYYSRSTFLSLSLGYRYNF